MTNNTSSINGMQESPIVKWSLRIIAPAYLISFLLFIPSLTLIDNTINGVIAACFIFLWYMVDFYKPKLSTLDVDVSYVLEPLFSKATDTFYRNKLNKYPIGNYVYVIKDASVTGYYKIGKTHSPSQRITNFDVKLPFQVEIITIIPCENMSELETWLHQTFSKWRINGEWFDLKSGLYLILQMDTNFITGRIYIDA